tara:strand:- start:246 stop:659 length:414 start_codon:yes stop_codon:yes gene_type:complete
MNEKTPRKSLLSTLTPSEVPLRKLTPQMKRMTQEEILEMLSKAGGADGRSIAAMKASGVSPRRRDIQKVIAKMKTGKGNPAGKDLSEFGKMSSQFDAMREKLKSAKKGGLMKAKKKKAKKSKVAGRLAKRGYGAAKK